MWRLLILGIVVALAPPPALHETRLKQAPEPTEEGSLQPYMEKANDAIRTLQSDLARALTSAMEKGGPGNAIFVCRDEAQAITAKVFEETRITVGRTSHRLRNTVNAPREWARRIVEESAGKTTSEVNPYVLDLGDKVGVLTPINTLGLCANCHGKVEEIDMEVKKSLSEFYPTDRAVGFSVGDLRGWMWAEVSKR